MRLARQASCAEAAIRKRDAALPLHIHWTLGFRAFGLGLILLLLLCAGLLRVAVNLALLALLRSRFKTFDSRLSGSNVVVVLALLFPECRIFGLFSLLLLPLLVCFLVQAVADMGR